MLSSICQELKNWFDCGRIYGAFEISEGHVVDEDFVDIIKPNQYFRIIGSVFNDGVYKYTDSLTLTDELFVGSIWLMAVPKEVVDLASEISAWTQKYNDTLNTPYVSESFGGYSYTKATNASGGNVSWQSAFSSKLNKWRKL